MYRKQSTTDGGVGVEIWLSEILRIKFNTQIVLCVFFTGPGHQVQALGS